ncbi:MAG: hypothetical protein JXA54_13340 [Candidatus Heimdallarchaeota archaeon]|nr:hypothetical protein [Candidatus Heimdallarchaeota archaeon]
MGYTPIYTTLIFSHTIYSKTIENDTDVFFIGLNNKAETKTQIVYITCFSFVNSSITSNPIEIYDNESIATIFPLQIEVSQAITLFLTF